MSPVAEPRGVTGSGSFMIRTNSTVPAGTLVHVNAGEIPIAPPACFWGTSPPSGHAVLVNVSPGPPRPPPRGAPPCPAPAGGAPPAGGACAAILTLTVTAIAHAIITT